MVPPAPDAAPATVVFVGTCLWYVQSRTSDAASDSQRSAVVVTTFALLVASVVLARTLLRSGSLLAVVDGGGLADAGPYRRFLPVVVAEVAGVVLLVASLERRRR